MKCERSASTIVSRFDRVFNFVIVEILKFHRQIREILIPQFEGLELVSKKKCRKKNFLIEDIVQGLDSKGFIDRC